MSKQQYITPSIAVTGDTTGFMNVISSTPSGELQVVTTGATVNTIAPDRHIVIGDVLVSPGHYKTIPTDYHIDGDLTIEANEPITIGTEVVAYEGYLSVKGMLNCTGTIDIKGTLFPGYGPSEVGPTGSSGSAGVSGTSGISGTSGSSGATGSSGSSGISGTSGTSGTTATTGTSGTGGTAGTGIPMTSMIAWYKADAGVTSSGSHISQWDDQSGNAHHLYAAGDDRPRYGDIQLNGIDVPNTVTGWASDSTRKMETTTTLADIGSTGTIFMVGAQYVGETFYNYFFESGVIPGIIMARNGSAEEMAGSIDNSDNPPYVSIAPATNGTFYTARLTGDGTNSKLVLNGTIIGDDFPQTASVVNDTLMLFYGSNGRPGKKAIAEILIYSDLLSNEDILAVESYLRTKWAHY
jgi:hypothetical protein